MKDDRLEVIGESLPFPLLPAARARITLTTTPEAKAFVIRNLTFREAAESTLLFFLRRGADIRLEAVAGVDRSYAAHLRKKAKAHRKELAFRQENLCAHCGAPSFAALQIHHRLSIRRGGTSDIENLELICNACHVKVHKGEWG